MLVYLRVNQKLTTKNDACNWLCPFQPGANRLLLVQCNATATLCWEIPKLNGGVGAGKISAASVGISSKLRWMEEILHQLIGGLSHYS